MKGQVSVIIAILFIIVISVFAVLNIDVVEVNYLFGSGGAPLIFVILFSVLMGGVLTMLFGMVKVFQMKKEIRRLQLNNHQLKAEVNTRDGLTENETIELEDSSENNRA